MQERFCDGVLWVTLGGAGHFFAAKWVGIKVEQFAVGMGHALVSFRKGIGWRLGNTRKEYESRIRVHLKSKGVDTGDGDQYTEAQMSRAADELGLGETEYRLSWIPIGGYVKMLGQDDTRPGIADHAAAEHLGSGGSGLFLAPGDDYPFSSG